MLTNLCSFKYKKNKNMFQEFQMHSWVDIYYNSNDIKNSFICLSNHILPYSRILLDTNCFINSDSFLHIKINLNSFVEQFYDEMPYQLETAFLFKMGYSLRRAYLFYTYTFDFFVNENFFYEKSRDFNSIYYFLTAPHAMLFDLRKNLESLQNHSRLHPDLDLHLRDILIKNHEIAIKNISDISSFFNENSEIDNFLPPSRLVVVAKTWALIDLLK